MSTNYGSVPPTRLFFTPEELGELFGYDRQTIYKLIKSGQIPARRLHPDGRIFIPRCYVDRLSQERTA